MGGLLTVLGGAGAGGFKAMGENINERAEASKEAAKQAALEKRETNLARLQHGFRKEELGMQSEAAATEREKGRISIARENIASRYAEEEEKKKEREFKEKEGVLQRESAEKRAYIAAGAAQREAATTKEEERKFKYLKEANDLITRLTDRKKGRYKPGEQWQQGDLDRLNALLEKAGEPPMSQREVITDKGLLWNTKGWQLGQPEPRIRLKDGSWAVYNPQKGKYEAEQKSQPARSSGATGKW
ncbi:MAG: hypothetical protein QME44_01695 [Thermodesulfobacteriota bacterium]|nr:hypothetical protein [Thermodesulfobacteriota bacterium]